MRQVRHLLNTKGSDVVRVSSGETVLTALQRMAEYEIGALVVMDDGNLVGLMSERDYARKVILKQRHSSDTPVAEIMSRNVVVVSPDASVAECMQLCTDKRMRHLPVVENDTLVGLVSIGDLVKAVIDQQSEEIEHLQNYISG